MSGFYHFLILQYSLTGTKYPERRYIFFVFCIQHFRLYDSYLIKTYVLLRKEYHIIDILSKINIFLTKKTPVKKQTFDIRLTSLLLFFAYTSAFLYTEKSDHLCEVRTGPCFLSIILTIKKI